MSDDLGTDIQLVLNELLKSTRKSDGAERYSYTEIVDQIRAMGQSAPEPEDLARMAGGQLDDPDTTPPAHLRAIAAWAGHPNAFSSEIIRLKIKQLRRRNRRPDGEQYTLREIAEQIHQLGFDGPSYSYLSQIVNGHRPNPGMIYLQAIAHWAGVPMSYYFDDELAGRVDEQLEQLTQERARLREARAQQQEELTEDRAKLMALRASELSDKGFEQVSDILDVVHRLEHGEDTSTG